MSQVFITDITLLDFFWTSPCNLFVDLIIQPPHFQMLREHDEHY